MADHGQLDALPKDHWIHGALAKTKKGAAKKPMVKAMAAMPMKKPAAVANADEGDHEYR